MAKLRYVRSLAQIKRAQEANPEFLPSTVRSIRCLYETDPRIAAALLPKPLELARPEIGVTSRDDADDHRAGRDRRP
jgi:acetoacetate decarboxylase